MNEFARMHGFIGNCDEGLTIDYVYTELVRKAEEGDKTAMFKMESIARHSKDEVIAGYAKEQYDRIKAELYGEEPSVEGGEDDPGDDEGEDDPETPGGNDPEEGGTGGSDTPSGGEPVDPENPVKDPAATVGGVEYETFAAAIEAAEEGAVITLEKDTDASGIVFEKSVILDLNGHTYYPNDPTVGSAGTETLGFQLLKGNDITIQNGTLSASSKKVKMLVQNYANLTLNNVTLDGTQCPNMKYVLSNNNGTVTIIGNTNIIAPEGAVAFDVYDFSKYYNGVTVNVNTTGTIVGKIEVGGDGVNRKEGEYLADLNIAGGTFTVPVDAAWCAAGYEPVDNGDGTYGVRLKSTSGGSGDDVIYDGGTIAL